MHHQILLLLSKMKRPPKERPRHRSEAQRRAERAANVALCFVLVLIAASVVQIVAMLYFETHFDVTETASYGNLKYTTGLSLLLLGQSVLAYMHKRSDAYAHKATHETNETANAMALNAQEAAVKAESATEKAEEVTRRNEEAVKALLDVKQQLEPLVKATNGNLQERINQIFEQARNAFATPPPGAKAFPGTMEELEKIMDARCGTIAMNAARLAVKEQADEFRRQGILPPEARVQT